MMHHFLTDTSHRHRCAPPLPLLDPAALDIPARSRGEVRSASPNLFTVRHAHLMPLTYAEHFIATSLSSYGV